ncbi:hypothetical protein EHS25_004983 [Saitozyma podzolica]|uniref:Protein CPL1-like domain-containing protein n=1 Tax=Saitozyma podzolica TaxID=1890683 RepID=A0A427Y1Z7_9TREE|nr:hypothetical protein EHS25_004983 [Saitozyma podzolica]
MLFHRATALAVFLSLAKVVSANGLSMAIGSTSNWGCSSSQRSSTPSTTRSQCSGSGDFLCGFGSSSLCSSPQTRTTPSGDCTCPLSGWDMHKTAKVCIPTSEVSQCDCGEGYSFSQSSLKWHERSSSCCDNNWQPDQGTCPSGSSCPTDWYWHKTYQQCRPQTPRSPEPDCSNWNSNKMCCGGTTTPSQGTGGGSGGSGGSGYGGGSGWGSGSGNGRWAKRDVDLRHKSQLLFPQTDLDKMYCPGSLHACSILTSSNSDEWAYECIDFATELESCGGCASTGEGADCTSIPNAMSVGCESGVCAVYTCQTGFTANGTSCVTA